MTRPTHFPTNFRLTLEARGMSQRMFAALSGMPPRRVSRLSTGQSRPHADEIPDIAGILSIPPEALAWEPSATFRTRLAGQRSQT